MLWSTHCSVPGIAQAPKLGSSRHQTVLPRSDEQSASRTAPYTCVRTEIQEYLRVRSLAVHESDWASVGIDSARHFLNLLRTILATIHSFRYLQASKLYRLYEYAE